MFQSDKFSARRGRRAILLTLSLAACAVPVVAGDSASDAQPDLLASIDGASQRGLVQLAGVQEDGLVESTSSLSGLEGVKADTRETRPTLVAAVEKQTAAVDETDLGVVVPMSSVARISLRVRGLSEFNGEYAIDAGTMSIPGIGRFDVSDKSIVDLEKYVSARMSEAVRRDVAVSAEVVHYKPYYVTGHVVQPGELAWRPGLTVIQAVTLAGGETRGGARNGAGGMGDSFSTLQQARTQLRLALAQKERLNAEKGDLERFTPSARLVDLTGVRPSELDSLVERQNELLDERRSIMQTQLDSLAKEHESASQVLKSAGFQSEAVKKQLALARELLESIGKLRDKKLIANSRYLEQQSAVAGAELRLAEVQAIKEEARARVAAVERQMISVRQDRLAAISDRMDALEQQIAQYETTISSLGFSSGAEADAETPLDYNIARASADGIETIPANVFTKVLPGDVIIVTPRPAGEIENASLDNDRLPSHSDPMRAAIVRTESLLASSIYDRSAMSGRATRSPAR